MAKLVARVREILQPGIHKIGYVQDGELISGESLLLPDRIEIETSLDESDCMMYRYTRSGDFCGDTWHEDLESAFEQAKFEYGLGREDFLTVLDGSQEGV